MSIFHMQHRKYPGNSIKLKEAWGRKDHLLSWVSTDIIKMRLTRGDLNTTHTTPWESVITHCLSVL